MDLETIARAVRCGGDLESLLSDVDYKGALALADAAEGVGSVDEAAMYHAAHIALAAALGRYSGCSEGLTGMDAVLGARFVEAVRTCQSINGVEGDEFWRAVVKWLNEIAALACRAEC